MFIFCHFRYLRQVKQLRQEGWDIVYTDETWVNQNHSHQGGWTENKSSSMTALSPSCKECSRFVPSGKGPRLIVLDAGSANVGFIPDAGIIFQSKTNSIDYHDEMNTTHYLEWFEDNLLRKLDRPSVVVLDNAPYHNSRTLESRNPTTSWRKEDIQAWLTKQQIEFQDYMLKSELLEIAGRHRLAPVYETDVLAESYGHRILRLPVRHCELNPIELIQAQLKSYVARNNNTFKLQDVKTLFLEAKETITREDWAKAVQHVINDAEAHFSRVDCLDRPEHEPVVIPVDELDSDIEFDSEDEFDGMSSSDEEDEGTDANLGEGPSSTLQLTAQLSSAALSTPGSPLDAMELEGNDDEVCGCCGRRDPSNAAGGDTEWVQCDACSLWYHQLCEKAPPGGFTDYFICAKCQTKIRGSKCS